MVFKVVKVNKNKEGNIVSYTLTDGKSMKDVSYEWLLWCLMPHPDMVVNARVSSRVLFNGFQTPPSWVVSYIGRGSVIVKIHVHSDEPESWDYITVRRGKLRRGERRFMVTAKDGRTFEPGEDIKTKLNSFLTYECGVLYRDYREVEEVDSVVWAWDSLNPLYRTYYLYNSKVSDSKVYTFSVHKDYWDTLGVLIRCSNVVQLGKNDLYSLGSWAKKEFSHLSGTTQVYMENGVAFMYPFK